MARIRNVKPAFFRHRDLFLAEKAEKLPLRVAYCGLWTCCDINGVFPWRPWELKLDVLPYDEVDFDAVLNALLKHRFVSKFADDEGNEYGHIPTLKKHQRFTGKEAKSGAIHPNPYMGHNGETPETQRGNTRDTVGNPGMEYGDMENGVMDKGDVPSPIPGLDLAAWDRWLDYRRKIRKPLKPVSFPAAQKELAALGSEQAAAVEQSIAKGWIGVFPLKDSNVSRGTKTKLAQATEALNRA